MAFADVFLQESDTPQNRKVGYSFLLYFEEQNLVLIPSQLTINASNSIALFVHREFNTMNELLYRTMDAKYKSGDPLQTMHSFMCLLSFCYIEIFLL